MKSFLKAVTVAALATSAIIYFMSSKTPHDIPPAHPAQSSAVYGDQAIASNLAMTMTLDQHGVYYSSPDAAYSMGHAVCTSLDDGQTVFQAGVSIIATGDYTAPQAAVIVGAAMGSYCPSHLS